MNSLQKGFLFVAVALGALATGFYFNNPPEPEVSGAAVRSVASDVSPNPALKAEIASMTGGKASLSQWQGKVMVVNFWATWCPPCLKEIPDFVRMQTALEAKGVQFVGVAIDEADKVRQYAKKAGINYPILIGEFDATELGKVLGNKGGALPFTVIFDRGGRVVKTILGGTNESHLTPILQPYL
jgi:thiol-disulfide isomerase/thioredoxin